MEKEEEKYYLLRELNLMNNMGEVAESKESQEMVTYGVEVQGQHFQT